MSEARAALLDTVVRLAIERGSDDDLAAIERNVNETQEFTDAGLVAERARAATDFYSLLAAASHNQALVMLVDATTEIVRQVLGQLDDWGALPLTWVVPQRRALLTLLRDRAADEAAIAVRSHVAQIEKAMQERLSASVSHRSRVARRKPPVKSAVPRKPTKRGAGIAL